MKKFLIAVGALASLAALSGSASASAMSACTAHYPADKCAAYFAYSASLRPTFDRTPEVYIRQSIRHVIDQINAGGGA